jgi:hypothetical protein
MKSRYVREITFSIEKKGFAGDISTVGSVQIPPRPPVLE